MVIRQSVRFYIFCAVCVVVGPVQSVFKLYCLHAVLIDYYYLFVIFFKLLFVLCVVRIIIVFQFMLSIRLCVYCK